MNDPDLADLDAFAAVARQRGFRGAAAARGVSASTLSEAVRRLEARLGVRLLNRTTRSVTPTEAGQRLLERLDPALGEITAALETVGGVGGRPAGTLRLNVPTFVARVILPPMLDRFLLDHPDIAVEVVADDSFIDVLAAGFDAGIRYDEKLERDMIAVPIGPRRQRFATGATTSYLERRGVPLHPRDLLQHACIRHRFASGRVAVWEFERAGELVRVEPRGPVTSSVTEIEISSALAGVGIVSSFEEWLAPHFARGALVPVLEDWWQSFSGPYLYYPSRTLMPAPLRAFVDHVKAWRGA